MCVLQERSVEQLAYEEIVNLEFSLEDRQTPVGPLRPRDWSTVTFSYFPFSPDLQSMIEAFLDPPPPPRMNRGKVVQGSTDDWLRLYL